MSTQCPPGSKHSGVTEDLTTGKPSTFE